MNKFNIIIVDDDAFFKQTLAYQLKKIEGVDVVHTFDDGKKIVDYIQNITDEIIIMDVSMPNMDGILATKEIKNVRPEIPIIMLSSHSEKNKVLSAFNAGANAYCIKQIKIDELINVIEIIAQGGFWIDKSIAQYMFDILKNINNKEQEEQTKVNPDEFNITKAELDVLKYIADGLSNAEIAQNLFISHNTVKNHVASIISKLKVKDRTQIAIFALKNIDLN
ncbi:response regulator transcription factor [bacterium]|nr:response regulator transcription factor [bacterium]